MSRYEELAEKLGKQFSLDFSLKDWFGTLLHVYVAGEETPESLMLTGGFRGDCRVAADAVVKVAGEIEVSKRLYLAPSFDPTGLNGLGFVLERLGEISSTPVDGVEILEVGNLLVAYPEHPTSIGELAQRLQESFPVEKYHGFNAVLARGPEPDSPARSMHVEDGALLPLDTWRDSLPGHVSDVAAYINSRGPQLYIELGCMEERGLSFIASRKTREAIGELLDLAAFQIEDESILPLLGEDLTGETTSFHALLENKGIYVVRVAAGGGEDEALEALATAALSLINSYAFLKI